MKIVFLPIDDRPVCYTLPKLIAQIDESVELLLPKRSLLGNLKKNADVNALLDWLSEQTNVDAFVISLDTIAYGGLIPSRKSEESFDEISARLEKLKNILQGKKVYAFSSIMRISDNNINEEEKVYWAEWGKKIFDYSQKLHRFGSAQTDVPPEILEDYLRTRKRNFEINKLYLNWQKEGLFDTLIFSKDDCAKWGLNVKEGEELVSLGAMVKTGADEIPLSLLARSTGGEFTLKPIFLEPDYKNLISNYEDISVEECVKSQIELAGGKVGEDADLTLFVNNFRVKQGEIVMKVPTEPFDGIWKKPETPYAIADLRNANGSDNSFVKALFSKGAGENFLGYSAWNTSANSLGSLILSLKIILRAKKLGTFNESAFNKLILTRFLDDWAYQANVRQELKFPDSGELTQKMRSYEKFLLEKFPQDGSILYSFPWKRLFEVEIEFI